MAGKIIADTIETGAGADISTSYVVNGSAKAWINFNGQGTIAARDSLNLSSLSDYGTGNYGVGISSSFSAADYSISTGATWYAGVTASTTTSIAGDAGNKPTTSSYEFVTFTTTTDVRHDPEFGFGTNHGDLA